MSTDWTRKIPISFGRPSFRRRLEDYYSIVAPHQLQNDWTKRFRQIWELYGGSDEKEAKLAAKLAKKYGNTICFLTVASAEQNKNNDVRTSPLGQLTYTDLVSEDSFQLIDSQIGSHVLDCLSIEFDPKALLEAPLAQIFEVCPWMESSNTLLDRVELFRPLLPHSDPLHLKIDKRTASKNNAPIGEIKPKPVSVLASIAAPFVEGPLSVLHRSMTERKRLQILIHYKNCIRGTLTGFLIGFDEHMNMILRDVDEVYRPRCLDDDDQSKLDIERERRMEQVSESNLNGRKRFERRFRKQMMVRGDNVVLVYHAEQEQTAWPVSSKPPTESIYRSGL